MPAPLMSDVLTIARAGDQLWEGEVDPTYSNGSGAFTGQFGGWTTAVLLKAAMGEAPPEQTPRSLTTHFFSPVRPGALKVRVRPLRAGRSVSFLQAEVVQGQDVRAQAVLTTGAPREDQFAHAFAKMPAAPSADADTLTDFSPPTPFGAALCARWISGSPFGGDKTGDSLFWSRTVAPSRFDYTSLALLADYMPPRVFYVSNAFIPSSTLSINLHFHGSPEEVAAVGEGHVLVDVRARRVASGYWDHSASFWSASGALLAVTEQMAMHRG